MIRGLARILILHAIVSFRVRGQIVSQKPPESANFRKKKFPPNSDAGLGLMHIVIPQRRRVEL